MPSSSYLHNCVGRTTAAYLHREAGQGRAGQGRAGPYRIGWTRKGEGDGEGQEAGGYLHLQLLATELVASAAVSCHHHTTASLLFC